MGYSRAFAWLLLGAVLADAQTVTITGRVLTPTGTPIAGATVKFKGIANTTTTNAEGYYSFSGSVALQRLDGYRLGTTAEGTRLTVNLDRAGRVAVEVFSLQGRLLKQVLDRRLEAGPHGFDLGSLAAGNQLLLVKVRLGAGVGWHKLSLQGGLSTVTALGEAPLALAKSGAQAADSLFVTHPTHHGGLGKINGRTVQTLAGTQNFRMFSSDKGWDACAPPFTFNFDQSAGALYYQQIIEGPQATNQEVLREVCQSIWKTPADIPASRKYTTYRANINSSVSTGVASTGGSTLNFNVGYINQQKSRGTYNAWYEIVGVLVHEAVHSYQPYYNTTGAGGFGEAVPDAIRALTGFFRWPTGSKCSGSYTEAYQTGGKYWYFMEMKHPGFINAIYKLTSGDIASRVQQVTGTSLNALVSECQTKGMP